MEKYTSEKEEVAYTAHFVVNPKKLLALLPPQITEDGSTTYAHHVTKEFRPTNGKEGITPGRERELHITGHVVADGVHTAIVESADGDTLTTNQYAHITIATAKGVPPVKSNEVIAAAVEKGTIMPINPPIKVKTVEGYYGSDDRIHTS